MEKGKSRKKGRRKGKGKKFELRHAALRHNFCRKISIEPQSLPEPGKPPGELKTKRSVSIFKRRQICKNDALIFFNQAAGAFFPDILTVLIIKSASA